MFRWESGGDALINVKALLLSLSNSLNVICILCRGSFTETLVSEYNDALPLKCGRTSAELNAEKTFTLRKCNCLNAESFAFLVKDFLE